MMQTFGEKYQMSSDFRRVVEFNSYVGHEVDYTVPETGERRTVFVPSGASVIERMLDDCKAA